MSQSPSSLIKTTISLSLPIATSRILSVFATFVGVLMLSHQGSQLLAASALLTPIRLAGTLAGIATLYALGAMLSHSYGANDTKQAQKIFQQGLILSVLLSVLLMALFFSMGGILSMLSQPKELDALIEKFFNIYAFSIPAYMVATAFQQLFLSIGEKRNVLLINLFATIWFLLIAAILIIGKFGLPSFGVAGLAWAYLLEFWGLLFAYAFIYCTSDKFSHFREPFLNIRFHYPLFKQLIMVGSPICFQISSNLLSFSVGTIMVSWIGLQELAIQQVVSQYFILLVVPVFALSEAGTILISRAQGNKQYQHIHQHARICMILGLVFGGTVMALFILAPHQLINLYFSSKNPLQPAMLQLATLILMVTGGRLVFDIISQINTGNLRGLLDTKFTMKLAIATTWLIGLPLGYVLAFPIHLGLLGFTLGGFIARFIYMIVSTLRWRNQYRLVLAKVV